MKLSVPKLLTCLLVVILSGCGSGDNRMAEDVKVGNKAPAFVLRSLDSKEVKSRSYEGSIVVLNFWATWCQNCQQEIAMFKQLAENSDVKVVGIALDEGGLKTVKPFVDKNGMNYTVLLGNQDIFDRFKGFAIPYTVVLDREQRIINIYRGPTTKESLEQDLKKVS